MRTCEHDGDRRRLAGAVGVAVALHAGAIAGLLAVRLTPPTPPGEQRIAIDLAPAMEALDSVEPAATQHAVASVAPPQEITTQTAPENVAESAPAEIDEAQPARALEALDPPDETKVIESTALAAVSAPSAITAVAPPEPQRAPRKAERPAPKPLAERMPRPKREEARRQQPPAAAANAQTRAGAAAASRQNLGGAGASGDPDALRRWTSQIAAVLRNRLRYPDIARSAGVSGVTTVRFVIASNGSVIASSVVRSAGNPVLDRAALAAAAPGASLPAAPPQVALQRLTISVPLQFSLR